jgi:hypothetical protein
MKTKKIYNYILFSFLAITIVFHNLRAQGYYKDIFMDGGVDLTSRQNLPAQAYLNLSMEFIATEDVVRQNGLMVSNLDDENGVLLYPDGEPRFRVIYTNGGHSPTGPGGADTHGNSLGQVGRNHMRQFFNNGGSFTGSCAGAYITALNSPFYYHIWPGYCKGTTLNTVTYTGHFITPGSPLLQYYDFGNDLFIEYIMHGGGCFADENNQFPPETEALLRYDYPSIPVMHDKISCWAYKKYDHTGRIVVIGSHPEGEFSGEGLELMAAILHYAIDGFGTPQVKDTLINSQLRVMDKNTSDNDPTFTKIGDKQYHHFMIRILNGTDSLIITLDGDDSQPFNLYVKRDSLAFRNTADYADTSFASDKTIRIANLIPGDWYIGVECDTTVTTTYRGWGYEYGGNLAILNGAEYSIKAEWNDPNAYPENIKFSRKFLKAISDSILVNTNLYNPFGQNVELFTCITSTDSVDVDSFPLFDDGFHNDSLAGDGFYGGFLGPVQFEKPFYTELIINDINNGYSNNFPCIGVFTSIGPVSLDHYRITSSDTIPNHGDNLKFEFTLRNEGSITTALNIKSQIVLLDTFSSILLLHTPQYGDIPPSGTVTGVVKQYIKFNSNSPDSVYSEFKLNIFSDDYLFWSDKFSVFVHKDPTGIGTKDENLSKKFTLKQNYPNPFNPSTTIEFSIPKAEFVTLKIYNLLGQEIEVLVAKRLKTGNFKYSWYAGSLSSGIYIYRIQAGVFQEVRKMVYLK